MRWTFYLRPGARWSNGDPVTAEDFVFSWRRLATEGNHRASILEFGLHLKHAKLVRDGQLPPEALGIEALNAKTLRLSLDQSVHGLPTLLRATCLVPVHKASVTQPGAGLLTPEPSIVSNGAYCSPSMRNEAKLQPLRNAYYWDTLHTKLERVDYCFPEPKLSTNLSFCAGEVDISLMLDIRSPEALRHAFPRALQTFPSLIWEGVLLNTADPLLQDPAIRQALSLLIYREGLLTLMGYQGYLPTYGVLGPLPGDKLPKLPDWVTRMSYKERCQMARESLKNKDISKLPP